MAVNGLIGGHLLRQRLIELPVSTATRAAIQDGFRQGKTVETLDSLISDRMIEDSGIVIAGSDGRILFTNVTLISATREDCGPLYLVKLALEAPDLDPKARVTVESRYDIARRRFLDYTDDRDTERALCRVELTVGDRLAFLFRAKSAPYC